MERQIDEVREKKKSRYDEGKANEDEKKNVENLMKKKGNKQDTNEEKTKNRMEMKAGQVEGELTETEEEEVSGGNDGRSGEKKKKRVRVREGKEGEGNRAER